MPSFLEERDISYKNLTELIVVDSMHERKVKMIALADGFIALPGGPGTLEEFFEIPTWAQLGLHRKPYGLLNINHYYDPLVALFNPMSDEDFLHEIYRSMALVDVEPTEPLDQFNNYEPPTIKSNMTENRPNR